MIQSGRIAIPFRSMLLPLSCLPPLSVNFSLMGHVASPHAVASFLRVSDHTIERISHESWSLDPGRTHVRRRRVGTAPQERPDWKLFFSDQAVDGTIVIADERSGEMLAYDVERAQKRFMPASTFLKCLMPCLRSMPERSVTSSGGFAGWRETGLDGWNQDQTLRSSMRHSTVWVYQQFAREIGEVREKEYLDWIQYGNADPSGGVDRFWLDGALRISAMEQVDFLRKLYRNELPFKVEHQRLVKDIMIVEAGRD